ncbi:dnaJ homolog subfamily B member 6-like [Oryza brachyantha]|uniref:J domain-containing protein n=1 Tax=Oryza brachyantha TaxID=4533 RepID=J3MC21_ORYBR|nr:dnaJ homolog subfamily B member 6-like [Oryza brachyantha]
MGAGVGGGGGGGGADADADLYAVLGLSRECTDAELRVAYRKLAMIWHPDRCSAAGGSSTGIDQAKERFQEIQGAYSVLSDSNKRFLYDVGVYDGGDGGDDDDSDLSGMGDFLGEMAQMMSQATPTESFEELQQLFVDMFQDDIDAGICGIPAATCTFQTPAAAAAAWSFPSSPPPASRKGATNKRCSPSPAMDSSFGLGISGFCFKAPWTSQDASTGGGGGGGKRRKQRPPAASRNV